MNLLCNINQSFADLLINYLNLTKERSSCSEVFCEKGVLRNFKNPFFQRIPLVASSERVNADETASVCSVAVAKENISGEG